MVILVLFVYGANTFYRQKIATKFNCNILFLSFQDVVQREIEQRKVIQQLSTFPLGKFLLENKGVSSYWASYILEKTSAENPLENWLLSSAPIVLAGRECFNTFKKQLSKYIQMNSSTTFYPCDFMDKLLFLENFSRVPFFAGINFRPVDSQWISAFVPTNNFFLKNRLHSNTLYRGDDKYFIDLYRVFRETFEHNGIMITTFLTPENCWENYDVKNLVQQKIIMDGLQIDWRNTNTIQKICEYMMKSGFHIMDIICDTQKMLPIVVARATDPQSIKLPAN